MQHPGIARQNGRDLRGREVGAGDQRLWKGARLFRTQTVHGFFAVVESLSSGVICVPILPIASAFPLPDQ
jgi:hypothetical protein